MGSGVSLQKADGSPSLSLTIHIKRTKDPLGIMSNLTLLQQDCAVLRNIWPDKFPTAESCCSGYAGCSDTRVTSIGMFYDAGKTVDNSFPNIASLTGLTSIDLRNNGYTSIADNVFANMTELVRLEVEGNKFGGIPIPSSISNLPNLQRLNLFGAGVGGEIPRSLEKLTKLREFFIHGNTFNGTIPSWISNLKDLRILCVMVILIIAIQTRD
ncbi:hypothetical protein BC831DRAFT_109447 [Entophlyctis helioformis]|nr:hypothetical protein BC831DRAFT_109447 [Entophlyctis helioformis]